MRVFSESGHVREESLELHALGDLPLASALAVKRHLKECRRCQRESIKIAEFISILRALAAEMQSGDASLPRELPDTLGKMPEYPM